MAAGVPHLRGLQQYHEKEQSPLRHDRGGGAETQEAQEEILKRREMVHTPFKDMHSFHFMITRLQGLRPPLQVELPGGGVVLSALSFLPFQKMEELGFKMGEKTACVSFFRVRAVNFLCGATRRFCIGKMSNFSLFE